MSDKVIEVKFEKKERKEGTLAFTNTKVYADARVYAYYLADLIDEIKDHFWNNYMHSKEELDHNHAKEFDNAIIQIKNSINHYLSYLYSSGENEASFKALKAVYDIDFKILKDWLNSIGIPFKQANIIDIKHFIGMNN